MVEFQASKISTRIKVWRERANLKEKERQRVSAERESYVFGEEERRRRRRVEKRGGEKRMNERISADGLATNTIS